MIPYRNVPGLPSGFVDFLEGKADAGAFPDPPTLEAAAERARQLRGRRPAGGLALSCFRFRGEAGRRAAEELLGGRAVAVATGQQVGLLTGPLYTLSKALTAIRVAAEISRRGTTAVALFWMVADDHDLAEVTRVVWPEEDGPQKFRFDDPKVINRSPVGSLPVPEGIAQVFDRARSQAARLGREGLLARARAHYAAGRSLAEAFADMLLDLVGERPLLVLDPLGASGTLAQKELFARVVERPPEGEFPYFLIREGLRRKLLRRSERGAERWELKGVGGGLGRRELLDLASQGSVRPSANFRMRPVVQSHLLPVAAEILGPAELLYHAQTTPLFEQYSVPRPVYLPRPLVVPLGPRERRYAELLGLTRQTLLALQERGDPAPPEAAEALDALKRDVDRRLVLLDPEVASLDGSLRGAVETARSKITYQLEHLKEKLQRAAERKDVDALRRLRALRTWLLPEGELAERVYSPLPFLLRFGEGFVDQLDASVEAGSRGAVVVELEEG